MLLNKGYGQAALEWNIPNALLGHTSGIPNFTSDSRFGGWAMNAYTPTQEIAFFRDKPLQFEPGSKFVYSNSNYIVLGAVIEKVSGKRYADLLRERILDPLGMKDSGLDSDELILNKRAQGYSPVANGLAVAFGIDDGTLVGGRDVLDDGGPLAMGKGLIWRRGSDG